MSEAAWHLQLRSLFGPGAYLCVKGYGRTASTYALRAVYTQCPSDFTNGGKQMMCSSVVDAPESEKRYTGCSAEGVCECKAPYQKPLPQVYDGKYLHPSSTASCISACSLCAELPCFALVLQDCVL